MKKTFNAVFAVSALLLAGVLSACCCTAPDDFKCELDPKMNSAVQKILDDAVAQGVQTSAQCCVYIDGKMVVNAYAGTYSKTSKRKIDENSLFPIFSTGKAVFATTAHVLVEKGYLKYNTRVDDLWPAYSCNGKEDTLFWHILSHRSGLVGTPQYDGLLEYADWDLMVQRTAEMTPKYKPGTKTNYQPTIYAWNLGEIMCRATGRDLHSIITDEVLAPCGLTEQVYFGGMEPEAESRVAIIYPHATKGKKYVPGSKVYPAYYLLNQQITHKICIPSYCGIASAQGLAKFYAHLSGMLSPRLLKPKTLANATKLSRDESDPIPLDEIDRWIVFGMGYVLYGEKDDLSSIFGHGGLGGSEAIVDMKKKIAVAYTASDDNWEENQKIRHAIFDVIGMKVRGQK